MARWSRPGSEYIWRPEAAERVLHFIELLPHTKGEWARRGETIKLEPWQCFVIGVPFGWLRPDGLRRFRTVYIEVPRKNAKSTISSGIGLYMLAADGEAGSEVYSAATTRDQAKIVFQAAQQMARRSEGFRRTFGVEVPAHTIIQAASGSKFAALSADGETLDGLNVHCGIIDELHAHKSRAVWDVMETATGSRSQPLLWAITTAGSNQAGICYEQRKYVTKLLDRVAQDETYFGAIFTIDEGDDPFDKDSWRKANPNYGVSVYPDDLERKARKAQQMPSATNNFLTKHLNCWVNADTAWMDMAAWERAADRTVTPEQLAGCRAWIGIDLATRSDIAAVRVLVERDKQLFTFGKHYVPEETVEVSDNASYSGWVRTGHLIATDGAVTDFGVILDDLEELCRQFQVQEIAFDPYQALPLQQALMDRGVRLPMIDVSPNVKNFSPAMKEVEALVLDGRLKHDGDDCMTWMVRNVVAHTDAKDNIYPRKEHAANKIDGLVALLLAVSRWMVGQQPSVYSREGLMVF